MTDTDPFAQTPGADQDPFTNHDTPKGYQPVWLRTRTGVEFLDVFTGDNPVTGQSEHKLMFLVRFGPVDTPWSVGLCSNRSVEGGEWVVQGVTYEDAKMEAEAKANALSVDAGGNAQWRSGPPSPGQLSLIEKMDLDGDTVRTKGDASDILNIHFGSKVLDPVFGL